MIKTKQVLLALFLTTTAAIGAAPPLKCDPNQGVIFGKFLICVDYGFGAELYLHRIDRDVMSQGLSCATYGRSPLRWHVGYDAFWVSFDYDWPNGRDHGGAGLTRIDLTFILSGKFAKQTGTIWPDPTRNFAAASPATRVRNRGQSPGFGNVIEEELFVYYDFLPFGKRQARQFVLSNVPTKPRQPEAISPARPGEFSRAIKKIDPLPWTLFYYQYEGRWNAKDEAWEERPWTCEGSIKVKFTEPFQALAIGDDFYFVTRSGSLFCAPKAAKGKNRIMTCIWNGKERPITMFITDVDTARTYLFVSRANEGSKPAFFVLSARPMLVEYDPKAVAMPPLTEPHRTLLHRARILLALKKIKGK